MPEKKYIYRKKIAEISGFKQKYTMFRNICKYERKKFKKM